MKVRPRVTESDEEDTDEGDTWAGLVDNQVGRLVSKTHYLVTHASLERCLESAGLEVRRAGGHSSLRSCAGLSRGALRMRHADSGESGGLWGGLPPPSPAHASTGSSLSDGILGEHSLIRQLFGDMASKGAVLLEHQHLSLHEVVRQVFAADCQADKASGESALPLGISRAAACCRRVVGSIANSRLFVGFFILLTVYALVGPDAVPLFFDGAECELSFLMANTTVFGLFCVELVVLVCGNTHYSCSLAFLMDLLALVGVWGDTWFARRCVHLIGGDESGARLPCAVHRGLIRRVVDSTGGLFRALRLVPRLVWLLRRRTMELAGAVVGRKVWHTFSYLDKDSDGFVSPFDFKVFYFVVLQTCPHMLRQTRASLLEADLPLLKELSIPSGGHPDGLAIGEFIAKFKSTRVGKEVLSYHHHALRQQHTAWSLTTRLSESVAVKVCALVLVLLVTLSASEPDVQDRSPEAGLAHLEALAAAARGRVGGAAGLCEQVGVYSRRHGLVYLSLAWRTYADAGRCLPAGAPAAEPDVRIRLGALLKERRTGAALVCLRGAGPGPGPGPGQGGAEGEGEGRGAAIRGLALLDRAGQARSAHLFSLATTACVVTVLLLFLLLLMAKVRRFTKTFVSPLQMSADDMAAMSSLEIQHDPHAGRWPKGMSDELLRLRAAFQSFQAAIRSWSMFVPPGVVKRLFLEGLEAKIGVATCHVTVLFCDIEGFEQACRGLLPGQVLRLLSDVLGRIADVILASEGTLIEFIGDEVLAVFGAPHPLRQHASLALQAAMEIHRVIGDLSGVVLETGGELSICCRVGIHTSEVLAGNIGSARRMKYGVLGDGVNLAARLKSLNSRYHTRTLASGATLGNSTLDGLVARPVDAVVVKGRKEPTVAYEVFGTKEDCPLDLRMAALKHREAFGLYHEQRFAEAKRRFEEVPCLVARGDKREDASTLLARRCAHFMRHPPPPGWDGVERLVQKTWQEGQTERLGCFGSESTDFGAGCAPESAYSTKDSLGGDWKALDVQEQPLWTCGWWKPDGASWASTAVWLRDLLQGCPVLKPSGKCAP